MIKEAGIDWTLTWNTVLAISTGVMAAAIIATVVYAYVQLKHFKKTRCSDLLMRLHQTWDSKDYIQSRRMIYQYSEGLTSEENSQKLKEALAFFDNDNAEEYYLMVRIANFFENLGFLADNNHISQTEALDLFGDTAANYWNRFEAWCIYYRENSDEPQPKAWVYFQKLALGFPKEKGARNSPSTTSPK